METFLLAAAIVFVSQPVRPQTPDGERGRIRREKLEMILRLQDLRTPFDGRLAALLSDDDPVVRRRATLACGSLQDTSAIGLLTRALTDPDSATDFAAAFALGQTGTRLSERSRTPRPRLQSGRSECMTWRSCRRRRVYWGILSSAGVPPWSPC